MTIDFYHIDFQVSELESAAKIANNHADYIFAKMLLERAEQLKEQASYYLSCNKVQSIAQDPRNI